MRNARFLVGVLLLCLGACATPPQTLLVLGAPPSSLPRHAELTDVPYFAQDAYQCGPASLAMTLSAAGIAVTPETLKPELYLPERHGSLQIEMLAAARRQGAVDLLSIGTRIERHAARDSCRNTRNRIAESCLKLVPRLALRCRDRLRSGRGGSHPAFRTGATANFADEHL